MKRVKPTFSCLIFVLTLAVFLPSPPSIASDLYYRYTDKNGTVHFTDRYEGISPEYKDQVQIIRERSVTAAPSSPAAEPKRGRPADEQARRIPEARQEKAAEQEISEKAATEAEEKKFQARLEKEKQIEGLKKEIETRREEQKNLRTNWMVHDRATLYRLNQEIEDIQKRVRSLEEGL